MWIKADRLHTLIPRTTDRWKAIYRTRGAVEREFGRLKHEWGLGPLRVRRLPRVQLHADLTILTRLASALLKARPSHWRHRPRPHRARQRRAIRHVRTLETDRRRLLTPSNRASHG
ncbi:MAG: transposase [Pseudonocardiaceae bacterium]